MGLLNSENEIYSLARPLHPDQNVDRQLPSVSGDRVNTTVPLEGRKEDWTEVRKSTRKLPQYTVSRTIAPVQREYSV